MSPSPLNQLSKEHTAKTQSGDLSPSSHNQVLKEHMVCLPSCSTISGGNTLEANARLKMALNSLSKPPMPILLKSQSGLMMDWCDDLLCKNHTGMSIWSFTLNPQINILTCCMLVLQNLAYDIVLHNYSDKKETEFTLSSETANAVTFIPMCKRMSYPLDFPVSTRLEVSAFSNTTPELGVRSPISA